MFYKEQDMRKKRREQAGNYGSIPGPYTPYPTLFSKEAGGIAPSSLAPRGSVFAGEGAGESAGYTPMTEQDFEDHALALEQLLREQEMKRNPHQYQGAYSVTGFDLGLKNNGRMKMAEEYELYRQAAEEVMRDGITNHGRVGGNQPFAGIIQSPPVPTAAGQANAQTGPQDTGASVPEWKNISKTPDFQSYASPVGPMTASATAGAVKRMTEARTTEELDAVTPYHWQGGTEDYYKYQQQNRERLSGRDSGPGSGATVPNGKGYSKNQTPYAVPAVIGNNEPVTLAGIASVGQNPTVRLSDGRVVPLGAVGFYDYGDQAI